MPKVYLSIEERECNRFSDFIRGELKRQKKRNSDLAYELNLSPGSITQKLNGSVKWSLPEIIQALNYLDSEYVFGKKP